MPELGGSCILITREAGDNQALRARIETAGGMSLVIPLIRIAPPRDLSALENARASLDAFDWIALTSRHGARALLERRPRRGERPRIATVGGATAAEAEALGWTADLVAEGKGAEALADLLISTVPGQELRDARILHPCSNLAAPTLAQRLASTGAAVERAEVYETRPPGDAERQDLLAHLAWINGAVFASPSAVEHLLAMVGTTGSDSARAAASPSGLAAPETPVRTDSPQATWACAAIGATTRAALEAAGFMHVVAAERPDAEGLFAALAESWKRSHA